MKIVVGLGNPGDRYADTYHNVGFMALDALVGRFRAPDFKKKDDALVTEAAVGGNNVLFVKPLTYMNLSGDAVSRLARFYKIPPQDILVLYDDIDIKKGTVRARKSGSAGTHNGMRDIVAKLGATDFARVRIGIGLKPEFMNLADYVLSHVQPFEQDIISRAAVSAGDFVEDWICGKEWTELTVEVSR